MNAVIKKPLLLVTLIGVLSVSSNSYAMYPVIDWKAIAQRVQELQHLQKMIDQGKQQLSDLHNQLLNAKAQLSSLTGRYGWGNLWNSVEDLSASEYTPSSWSQTLKGVAGGGGARYQALLAAYKKAHPVVSQSQYRLRNTEAQAQQFTNRVNTVNASAAIGEKAYSDVNKYLKITHDLTAQIESDKNTNIKSAIDLNSRLAANNANLLAALIRLQAVLTNLKASQQQAALQAESQQQQFMALDHH